MQSVCDTFVSGFCCFHWTSPTIWYPSTWRFPEFSLPVIRFNLKTLSETCGDFWWLAPPHFEKLTMYFCDSSPWFQYAFAHHQLSHGCLWHAADTAPWPAAWICRMPKCFGMGCPKHNLHICPNLWSHATASLGIPMLRHAWWWGGERSRCILGHMFDAVGWMGWRWQRTFH